MSLVVTFAFLQPHFPSSRTDQGPLGSDLFVFHMAEWPTMHAHPGEVGRPPFGVRPSTRRRVAVRHTLWR